MFPFHPPLPTASNLPFQFDAGNHTSILMSESGVGFTEAATRQNAGRSLNGAPPPRPPPPAGANAPAATDCASVIVVSGSFSEARLSHGAADTGRTLKTRTKTKANDKMTLIIVGHLVGVGFNLGKIIAADRADYTVESKSERSGLSHRL